MASAPIRGGMVTSPHARASAAGRAVLARGGDAVEAAVATAAALCVLYPHMTGLGGDAFWLVAEPGAPPRAIMGCGAAGRRADRAFYRDHAAIPTRGPLAALTSAGAVASWSAALGERALAPLLDDAVSLAADGAPVAPSLARAIAAQHHALHEQPGWSAVFAPDGAPLPEGAMLRQPRLAATLSALARDGAEGLYRGALAADIGADLTDLGAPIDAGDLAAQTAQNAAPLTIRLRDGAAYNTPPPTQGLAALIILALLERLPPPEPESFAHIHAIVEATKQAFAVRDRGLGDPAFMDFDAQAVLDDDAALDAMAAAIDPARATPWPREGFAGDTVWLGVIDAEGRAVSMIQSLYFEFGAGIVLPRTGLLWQNRGAGFRLDDGWNALAPGRLPFHTLCPAMARFDDGRVMVYGAMGGDGQPQTQAAVFTRHARHAMPIADAIAAPRWLLGRTWGDATTALRLEGDVPEPLAASLAAADHRVERTAAQSEIMGHAGAIVRDADGALHGGADPRSDGAVAWL